MIATCFLLLPALVYGKFTIDIDLTGDPYIDVRGAFTSVVDDADRTAFQINDDQLKKAVATYTNDKTTPNDVFVKKTGNTLDLHKTFNWNEVTKTVKPMVNEAAKQEVQVGCRSEPLDSDDAVMTINTDWVAGGNISNEFEYDVYLDLSLKVVFNSSHGEKLNDSKKYKLGKRPALKCEVSIDIKYETTLTGDVAANYPAQRKKSYFWAYDLANVQTAANSTSSIVTVQKITLSFYK